jgi:hypothetical protein
MSNHHSEVGFAGKQSGPIPIQLLPEQDSSDRMHILDEDCWCEPYYEGPYLVHAGARLVVQVFGSQELVSRGD